MRPEPRLDIIGAALADPTRARILCKLMDGRAFTNKELSCAANITPPTATAHLKQLERAGLTTSIRSGRHVYHRIASAQVASALEKLSTLTPSDHVRRAAKPDSGVLLARCCYNHLAGRLGVWITDNLLDTGVLQLAHGALAPGPRYHAFLTDLDLDPPRVSAHRPVAKFCLDWTERRNHISGSLGIAILEKALKEKWLARQRSSRSLTITPDGKTALARHFGMSDAALDCLGPSVRSMAKR
ncbi:ArsR/SmtB family transcription factor [Ruegeria arenilitoris]|uniref:ArsR/SmtB family transcription factor n=1 Tax=Ruegeria arenilitoris TaxID=1173585 RepID=UPI00147E9541|nr:winged helix-turn-helix domain-containing protein [Ruegeria arenilitoris]